MIEFRYPVKDGKRSKGLKTIKICSDPVWSPELGVWFVWTTCSVWQNERPWHVDLLPKEVQEQITIPPKGDQ